MRCRLSHSFLGNALMLSVALFGLTVTQPAFAQASATSPAIPAPPNAAAPASVAAPGAPGSPASSRVEEAERLFQRGVKRMDAGDFEAACPLLAQSQAADPSSGTLLNLGDCYEHLGRTASADRAFAEAIELARATGRQDRIQVAALRRSRLAPQLRRLRVVVSATAAPGMTVSLDDRPVPSNGSFAVDPGTYRVRASAPGFEDFVGQATAPAPGATLDVTIPELVPTTSAPAQPVTEAAQTEKKSLNGRQIAALTCGAVGVIGIVSGSVFGLHSLAKHNESDDYCDGNSCHDPRGVDAMESARTAGNISTASFIIGGAALGAAAALWFIRPATSDRGVSARVVFGPGVLDVRGTF